MEQGVHAGVNVRQCNGAAECRKSADAAEGRQTPEDFIEGMSCEGGCVAGPGNIVDEMSFKKERHQTA